MTDFGYVKATEDGTQIEINLRDLESVAEDARCALPSQTPVRVTFREEDFETLILANSNAHRRKGRIFEDLLRHAQEEHRKSSGDSPGA